MRICLMIRLATYDVFSFLSQSKFVTKHTVRTNTAYRAKECVLKDEEKVSHRIISRLITTKIMKRPPDVPHHQCYNGTKVGDWE